MKKRLLLTLLVLIALSGALIFSRIAQVRLAAESYLFGYPLVIMDATRASFQQAYGSKALHRMRTFPSIEFRDIVRPNVDTLYTTGFIDMAEGPWVFDMAGDAPRYQVMQFMDGWTNVFAAPGDRLNGHAEVRLLLVGPGWSGAVPDGLTLTRSPTNIVWLIGRTQTNGVADYALVHALQDKIQLRRLADWQANQTSAEAPLSTVVQPDKAMPPPEQIQAMDSVEFFSRLTNLMRTNPPYAADGPMLAKLQQLGNPQQWNWLDRSCIELGRRLADWKVLREIRQGGPRTRGWATPPALLGNYGTNYPLRAGIAMVGLGANLPQDALYPSANVDADGKPLNGDAHYRMHFNAGQLPPVNAFWSITAYGEDNYFIDNAQRRYAIGDRDALAFNADGSLDIWIQAAAPVEAHRSNWLPVKLGQTFLLNARLYWPKAAALEGKWTMPAIERLP
jgi:hypothetical protein